jgi:transposase
VSTGVAQGRSSDEVLGPPLWRIYERSLAIERIGLEAGPLFQWLYGALAEVGLPVICVETRHMKAALSAQINKSDRNDARGIAQMMRVGLYRPVHVKTLASQKQRRRGWRFLLRGSYGTSREGAAWN